MYVDGYNFYYGLKNGGAKWKRHYWLDIVNFFERMMLPDQELVEVNWTVQEKEVQVPELWIQEQDLRGERVGREGCYRYAC